MQFKIKAPRIDVLQTSTTTESGLRKSKMLI